MIQRNHTVRINVADKNGDKANFVESVVRNVPARLYKKLFNNKRQVLIIAPSDSVTGIEIFEKGGTANGQV